DNKGRTADFKNTIIIMTSNIGSHIIQEKFSELNEKNRDIIINETKNLVFGLLKQTIRPEFLNRIDEVIMFNPLTKDEIKQIVELQLGNVQKMLAQNSITLKVTETALEKIAELGYDPNYGARPVKRVIQQEVVNKLAKQIIAGMVNKGNEVELRLKKGEFEFVNL
ncbi:MAG: AAA family ATPase, partial [Bacteroidales bacterium]|nr:AAA family ATPase [Bacteroidales bacterium]